MLLGVDMRHNTIHLTPATPDKEHIELFARISSNILTAETERSFLQHTLADIGQVLKVSRVYIIEYHYELWSNTYEWVAPGVDAFKDAMQNADYSPWTQEGGIFHPLMVGRPCVIDDVTNLADETLRNFLLMQKNQSVIMVPLFSAGHIIGILGVDLCEKREQWANNTLNTLIILGNLVNNGKAYFHTRRRIRKKKEHVQALFDAFPFPIYIVNLDDYSVIFYNAAMSDFCNISQVEQKPCYKAFRDLDSPCSFCPHKFLKKDEPPYVWHYHDPHTGRDYKSIDRLMTWEHVDNAMLSVAIDISDSLRLQREQVVEREANLAKGRFLANMSHELRTPLNGILGMTHLAAKANSQEKIGSYLEKIQISSNNLLNIINDILDFSKIENNEMTLENRPFSLTEIIFEAQGILQNEANRKNIFLQCHVDDAIPHFLEGDSLRILQIILNLATNAIKFTHEGGVYLEAFAQKSTDTIQQVRLQVRDTGIGISQEQLKKLFQEFSQADVSTTRNYGGTGLGLTIVQRLTELMGGSVKVESILGEGSIFYCDLSLVKPQRPDKLFHREKAAQTDEIIDISGTRILLVEDNEINILIAKEVLEQDGCFVDCATDGSIALEMLEKYIYDLVLMDIQMPNMDGMEATRRIREQRRFDTLPIVAMSAHAQVQDHEKSRQVGMQKHITKPFNPDQLRKTIYHFTHTPFHFHKEA